MSQYNRAAEDLGNIVSLEHLNVQVPDQRLATLFYVTGLGLTRDPYQQTGVTNMWINAGRCQFHLPTGKPQVLGGHTVLILPTRRGLLKRLTAVSEPLSGTSFGFAEMPDHVAVTCPWGNRFRCYEPSNVFGPIQLGMPMVSIDVAPGAAAGIAEFYREIFGAPTSVSDSTAGKTAHVQVGQSQWLNFSERPDGAKTVAAYDGHHVAVYLHNFSGPHHKLIDRGLLTRESNQHEYRFINIVDLKTGAVLAKLEHEVRSMRHPGYARPLVNRNPDAGRYLPGSETFTWAIAEG
jgi:hypothetical protein